MPYDDPDCDDCTDRQALRIMARQADQLVTVTSDGHEATRQEIRLLGDRLDTSLRVYARLLLVALAIVAALSGVKMMLPDGTIVEPLSELDLVGAVDAEQEPSREP